MQDPDLPVILVVEDEELLQAFIFDALKDGGFDVLIAASEEEALTLLESGVRALVTDINFHGRTNGWDVARKAREIDQSLTVVYMTGTAFDEWSSQGVPNSILMQKPFAPAQLVTAVSQLLNIGMPPST